MSAYKISIRKRSTWLNEKSIIYDQVPAKVIFKEGAGLQLKKIIPGLIDKEKKILFVVTGPASKFLGRNRGKSILMSSLCPERRSASGSKEKTPVLN